LKDSDLPALDVLGEAAVSHEIVLTKADQVKPAELESRIAETRGAMAKRPAAFPDLIATSSRSGDGIPDLRAAVNRLLAERR
jgi:GTP-binding protein